ncbi:MAG: VanZ family protein [Planctomycetota bacterium]
MTRPGRRRLGLLGRWAPPAAWAALLLVLGSRPGDALPGAWIPDWEGVDKAGHLLLYGVLGYLAARATGARRPAAALAAGCGAALLVGVVDEWMQAGVSGRTGELADLVADLAGGAGGGWLRARRRRTVPPPVRS